MKVYGGGTSVVELLLHLHAGTCTMIIWWKDRLDRCWAKPVVFWTYNQASTRWVHCWLQIWRSIADYLSQSQPDILVLVHPLEDSETEKCILQNQKTPKMQRMKQDVLTGIASHSAHTTNLQQRLARVAGQLPAPRGTDVLQGKASTTCPSCVCLLSSFLRCR